MTGMAPMPRRLHRRFLESAAPEPAAMPTTAAPSITPPPATAAWALRAQFFVSGALFATWGVHVPTVKAHFGLGERALAWRCWPVAWARCSR